MRNPQIKWNSLKAARPNSSDHTVKIRTITSAAIETNVKNVARKSRRPPKRL